MVAPADEPGTKRAVVEVPNLEVLEGAVDGLPLRVDPLSTPSGKVRMSMLSLPGVSIATGLTGDSIRSSGGVVDGSIVVGVPLSAGDGSWDGLSLAPGRAWCYGPGAEHHGVAAKPPWWAAITVERALFSDGDQERLFRGPVVDVIESTAVERLADLIRAADSAAVDGASDSQAILLRTELVDTISALGDDPMRLQSSTAAQLVKRCESLARELGPIPTVRALADAVGTSDRWVRSAFSQTYGIAPSEYFRARALAGCRRDLEAAEPGSVTVTDVALRWGFWHLGRFSARYRKQFDEPPSVTLTRE
jgi:AraC-like DNA-binding protein